MSATSFRHIGHSVRRREGIAKLTGAALYTDDIKTPGALHGKTVRTSIPHGRVRKIEFLPGVPWDEIVVARAEDLPCNTVLLIGEDQPALCAGNVRHQEEPLLLLAHADPGIVAKAAKLVRVAYDTEPAILEMGHGEPLKELLLESGDLDAAFAQAEVILEECYETGSQEHVYIEPNAMIARWEGDAVTVMGSLQCPYYVHKAMKKAFGLADEQVNVIQQTTGGGFGGKEEFPSMLAIHAALLAKKAGRAVRLIYDRHEDMAASTKRHPSRTRIKMGAMRDGRLVALDMHFETDGGAYVTLSPVVLSRGVLHGSGPYRWQAARIRGQCWFTNSPPYGAFRGFGAPQSQFATEMHLNLMADKLGLCPAELRRRNFVRLGDALPTGQVLVEEPRMAEIMDHTLAMSGWTKKRAAQKPGVGRGVGLSAFFHGTGFTGSGEDYLKSRVAVATCPDGVVEILVASTEIGQGTETVFAQIAGEALELPLDRIRFRKPETRHVPNSGPTVASRTCSIVGGLVEKAARKLKAALGGMDPAEHVAQHGTIRAEANYEAPPTGHWDDKTYRGTAYGAYSWAFNVAEATVDAVTGQPFVESLWATFEVGRIVNPVLALGQAEGGLAQAIGWATCERVTLKDGVMQNAQMTNYIIPTSADATEIHVDFVETPYAYGAFGSKGLGEVPMDGPGPAVVTAINTAAGSSVRRMPAQAEEILR